MTNGMQKQQQASPGPYSVLSTVEALLNQAITLLHIQQQTIVAPTQQLTESEHQQLMSVFEAKDYLGVSEWALRESVRKKEIPHVRIQRRIYFRRRELEQWISLGMNQIGERS